MEALILEMADIQGDQVCKPYFFWSYVLPVHHQVKYKNIKGMQQKDIQLMNKF